MATSWQTAINWYKVACISVLGHRAQFFRPSVTVLRQEAGLHARLLSAPRNAIPKDAVDQRMGFGVALPTINDYTSAVLIRSVFTTPAFISNDFLDVDDDDNQLLHYPFGDWLANSSFDTHRRIAKSLHDTFPITDAELVETIACHSLQRRVLDLFITRRASDRLVSIVSRRLRASCDRFAVFHSIEGGFDHDRFPAAATLARENMRRLGLLACPPLHASAMRSLFNAWPIQGRFGGQANVCPLCDFPAGACLSHAVSCPVMREIIPDSPHLRHSELSFNFLAFLFADPLPLNEVVKVALWHVVFGYCSELADREFRSIAEVRITAKSRLMQLSASLPASVRGVARLGGAIVG